MINLSFKVRQQSSAPHSLKLGYLSNYMYLNFESNVSIKSLEFCPSPHVKHVKIMFILMTSEFENLFFHFNFFS